MPHTPPHIATTTDTSLDLRDLSVYRPTTGEGSHCGMAGARAPLQRARHRDRPTPSLGQLRAAEARALCILLAHPHPLLPPGGYCPRRCRGQRPTPSSLPSSGVEPLPATEAQGWCPPPSPTASTGPPIPLALGILAIPRSGTSRIRKHKSLPLGCERCSRRWSTPDHQAPSDARSAQRQSFFHSLVHAWLGRDQWRLVVPACS